MGLGVLILLNILAFPVIVATIDEFVPLHEAKLGYTAVVLRHYVLNTFLFVTIFLSGLAITWSRLHGRTRRMAEDAAAELLAESREQVLKTL